MEAIEFLKEAQRLCEQSRHCSMVCPLYERCIFDFKYEDESSKETWERIEKAVAIIEQWNKEHPIITNAQKFKEVFGEIEIKDLIYCRLKHDSEDYTEIEILEANWWDAPYKEPEHED